MRIVARLMMMMMMTLTKRPQQQDETNRRKYRERVTKREERANTETAPVFAVVYGN